MPAEWLVIIGWLERANSALSLFNEINGSTAREILDEIGGVNTRTAMRRIADLEHLSGDAKRRALEGAADALEIAYTAYSPEPGGFMAAVRRAYTPYKTAREVKNGCQVAIMLATTYKALDDAVMVNKSLDKAEWMFELYVEAREAAHWTSGGKIATNMARKKDAAEDSDFRKQVRRIRSLSR